MIALDASGHARVGYQARDISGGWSNPNPETEPDCVAGTDMTWSRLAIMVRSDHAAVRSRAQAARILSLRSCHRRSNWGGSA